ncbi:MAG: signal peptidase II [Actinobacteria bacterium]|nr:signal peptidase II [Actinomycetota bacterium]
MLRVVMGVALVVVLADQLAKWVVVTYREDQSPIAVIGDWVQLAVVRNSGAAFGLGASATVIFSLIAIGVAVVVVRQSRTLTSKAWAFALGALLGGAVGNVIDRLTRSPGFGRGAVVDFVDVKYFSVFNIADAALTLAAISIAILAVRGVPMSSKEQSGPYSIS